MKRLALLGVAFAFVAGLPGCMMYGPSSYPYQPGFSPSRQYMTDPMPGILTALANVAADVSISTGGWRGGRGRPSVRVDISTRPAYGMWNYPCGTDCYFVPWFVAANQPGVRLRVSGM